MPSKRQRAAYKFDPQSLDSQLSGLHAAITGMSERMDTRFDAVDARCLSIETQAFKTNGRVTSLEYFRDTSKAKLAGIAATLGVLGSVAWSTLKTMFVKGE